MTTVDACADALKTRVETIAGTRGQFEYPTAPITGAAAAAVIEFAGVDYDAVNGTLGAVVAFATVTNASDVQAYTVDAAEFLGVQFTVSVAV